MSEVSRGFFGAVVQPVRREDLAWGICGAYLTSSLVAKLCSTACFPDGFYAVSHEHRYRLQERMKNSRFFDQTMVTFDYSAVTDK